jgi:hypothetical protein
VDADDGFSTVKRARGINEASSAVVLNLEYEYPRKVREHILGGARKHFTGYVKLNIYIIS